MSDQIVQLAASDFDEAMSCLNNAFAEHAPHDFENQIPVLYRRTDEHMACNYAIRREGRIVAIVGLFPIEWCVGDVQLRVAGIGGVSTDPACRGQGLMQRLMTHVLNVIKQEGYDLSYLGGQRQRYRYFGWERGGVLLNFQVTQKNIDHDFADSDPPTISLEPISDDASAIQAVKSLHDAQPMHCVRPIESFYLYLSNWNNQPYIARDPSSRIVGYLVAGKIDRLVREFAAVDSDTAMQIARVWVGSSEQGAKFLFNALPAPVSHRIGKHAEHTHFSGAGNWQVFDWPKTVNALLRARHKAQSLPQGSAIVRIDDTNVTMHLRVDAAGASCELTNDTPNVTADASTMIRTLFGPTPPSSVLSLPESAAILEAWCPLPLSMPHQDRV